jgi:hypothetical protein
MNITNSKTNLEDLGIGIGDAFNSAFSKCFPLEVQATERD